MRNTLTIGIAFLSLLTPAFGQQTPRQRTVAVSTGSGYLGIGAQDIDAERAKALKMSEVRGAEIKNVIEESPAAKAGFKEGDVVLEYNGQRVEGIDQLTRMVGETPAGRQVKVQVLRNGATVTLTPTLETGRQMMVGGGSWSMPEIRIPDMTIPAMPPMDMPRMQMSFQSPMLGITGESLSQEEQFAEFLGVKDGVLVKSVTKDSAAEKAGLKAGDVIVKVDDSKVGSTREITVVLRSVRGKKTFTLTVVRNRKEMPVTVTVETGSTGGIRAMRIGPMRMNVPVVTVSLPIVVNRPQFRLLIQPNIRILKLSSQNRVI
jgi:serine protease Do